MPILEAVAALPAINNAITLLDRVNKVVKSSSNIDAQEAILELRSILLDVKSENLDLKTENQELRKQTHLKKTMIFDDPVYYQIIDDDKKMGPFCPHCFGKDSKQINLATNVEGSWTCHVCMHSFTSKEYKEKRRAGAPVKLSFAEIGQKLNRYA